MKSFLAWILLTIPVAAGELHVSIDGDDNGEGTPARPLRSISAAANIAQPGDIITIHTGTYRERVAPPRGGTSENKRITYQAAANETVIIKGSEAVRGWERLAPRVWKVTLPNSFFADYNPYKDLIEGDWFDDKGRPHHTGEVYLNGKSLWETHSLERVLNPKPAIGVHDEEGSTWTWFCESDEENTYLYANFHDVDPNKKVVEINVRDSCFYPVRPGCDFITVRGIRMSHAATQWAAPTAEQIGLIGTHWSKGWIIEDCVISDSKCSGITLGKDRATGHNVWLKDPAKGGAVHYNEVIVRAFEAGWSRAKIGSHIVRNNTIRNCGQTGICGSLGAIFSLIENNHIHDIWVKRQFAGAEIAGIKLHAPIDVRIRNNRVHHAGRGLWMDWMTQGTRVSANLCYENTTDDLFVEVNHGPFVVDNNLFLSEISLRDWSEGGAYVHNLFAGKISVPRASERATPYHEPHSTALAGLSETRGGDNRFYNNVFVGQPATKGDMKKDPSDPFSRAEGFGLWVYDACEYPLLTGGNIYFNGARPYSQEVSQVVLPDVDPEPKLVKDREGMTFSWDVGREVLTAHTAIVSTEILGEARVSRLPFEKSDGAPLKIDTDYFGAVRNHANPTSGPIENPDLSHKLP